MLYKNIIELFSPLIPFGIANVALEYTFLSKKNASTTKHSFIFQDHRTVDLPYGVSLWLNSLFHQSFFKQRQVQLIFRVDKVESRIYRQQWNIQEQFALTTVTQKIDIISCLTYELISNQFPSLQKEDIGIRIDLWSGNEQVKDSFASLIKTNDEIFV